MTEYSRVSGEAQELVIQSLSRNAQAVHEKYQDMAANLQQVVANQEVMMVGVFQDNQSRVAAVQSEQEQALEQLKHGMAEVKQQSEAAVQQLRQQSDEQSRMLGEIYQQTSGGASQMKQSQEQAISSLEQSVASLQEQHGRLQQMMDESIAKQKTMATELINEHMARIIEHYLIGALGERSDLAKDLPNILEKMQEHKQAMMDDMSL
jgi:ATP-dependent Clp protease ATP-binding subunit ClpA